jgi:hypothetical protein
MDYHRYVDDIVIIYNTQKTIIISTLEEFNAVHPKLKFTLEQQTQNRINYLDLTITNNQNDPSFKICIKPTFTDHVLHNTSCHPYEHKKSSINYLYNWINTYKLTKENKKREKEIIAQILKNNELPPQIKKKGKKKSSTINAIQKDKWITFTDFGPSVRIISMLFRNTNMKVTFRTSNTIKHHVKIKQLVSGLYQMACKDCPLKYIGQMGRTFRTRYKEHIRTIKRNGQSSKFTQHVLDMTHNHNTMERTMKILHVERKWKMLNSLENYHIYKLTKQRLQINEALTDTYNPIYDILIKTN